MKTIRDRLGGTLFGVLFAGAGLLFLFLFAGKPVLKAIEAQAWQASSATILHSELKRHYGDDTTTYQAIARYEYYVNGLRYSGSQVSVHGGSDNFGSYQEDMARKLSIAKNRQEAITIWVNPNDPRQSIIDRNLRIWLTIFPVAFCSIFIIIGLGVLYLSWRSTSNTVASDPQKPWTANPNWSPEGITSDNKIHLWAWWFAALFVNTISTPILFQYPKELSAGNYFILIGLIFNAAGLFFIVKGIQKTLENWRFGKTLLVLAPFPGQVGGQVAGYIDIHLYPEHIQQFIVLLQQKLTQYTRSAGETNIRTDITWELSTKAILERTAKGTRVNFFLDVPSGMEQSKLSDGPGYWWSLTIKGDVNGIDFNRTYEIPVYEITK